MYKGILALRHGYLSQFIKLWPLGTLWPRSIEFWSQHIILTTISCQRLSILQGAGYRILKRQHFSNRTAEQVKYNIVFFIQQDTHRAVLW